MREQQEGYRVREGFVSLWKSGRCRHFFSLVRIPAETDQHSWVIPITVPA